MSTITAEDLNLETLFDQVIPCEHTKQWTNCPEGDSQARWRVALKACGHFSLICSHHKDELCWYVENEPSVLYCDVCDKNYLPSVDALIVERL